MVMPLYILDTDTATHLRNGHPKIVHRVNLATPGDVRTTSVTVHEQVKGWIDAIPHATKPADIERIYKRLTETVKFYSTREIMNYSMAAIVRFQSLLKLKLNIGRNDLRIGAIALEVNAVVVTANTRDFGRIPGLTVEDWTV
jgi:tRNA(fMet)-specific endonuclease VapC